MHLLKKYFNKFLFRFISELIMITYGNFIDKFKDSCHQIPYEICFASKDL